MIKTNVHSIRQIKLFIALGLLLSLLGCGRGGGGTEGILSSQFRGTKSVEPADDKSITLTWSSPTTNSDGSDLNDLVGYKIYYGPSSSNYTQSIDAGTSTSAVISGISSGSWCFATTAYDDAGNESDYSNEACTTI